MYCKGEKVMSDKSVSWIFFPKLGPARTGLTIASCASCMWSDVVSRSSADILAQVFQGFESSASRANTQMRMCLRTQLTGLSGSGHKFDQQKCALRNISGWPRAKIALLCIATLPRGREGGRKGGQQVAEISAEKTIDNVMRDMWGRQREEEDREHWPLLTMGGKEVADRPFSDHVCFHDCLRQNKAAVSCFVHTFAPRTTQNLPATRKTRGK